MKWVTHCVLIPAALAFSVAVCGCGGPRLILPLGGQTTAAGNSTTDGLKTSQTNSKPEAMSRAGFARLQPGFPEAELPGVFGPPQKAEPELKSSRRYTWTSGSTKLEVVVKDGKVAWYSYPGEPEEQKARNNALQAARAVIRPLREYALKNRNRFPARLEDLDLAELKKSPDTMAVLSRGDVVVPWGKSANRLVWAWWKDTPQFGGPYVRFDDKDQSQCTPQEFARLEAIVLTAATIPADIVATGKPGPGEPATFAGMERKDVGAQGFFTAGNLMPLLSSKPGSVDEVAKHLVRNYWHVEALRMVEKGEIIVRWGRDPKQGVYAYPSNFPRAGTWAIYKGQWAPFEREEEARKAFDE